MRTSQPGRGAGGGASGPRATLVAGVLGGLMLLSTPMSMPAVIFTGPLERFLGLGIGLAVLSTAVMCVVLAWRSSYPAVLGNAHLAPGLIVAVMAGAMVTRLGPDAPDAVVLGTLVALMALSTMSLGLVLLLFGQRGLGNLIRYVPYPVTGGLLAYVGLRLLHKGMEIMLGHELTLATSITLLQAHDLPLWLPGLLAAIALMVLQQVRPNSLNMPLVAALAIGLFWLVAWIAGISMADLWHAGYLLPRVEGGWLWSPALLLGALGQADWWVVVHMLPQVVSLWLVSLIVLLLVASNIEVVTRADMDLNQELKAAGIANLLAGLGAGLPAYHSAGASTLVYALGARSRLVGLIAATVCVLVLLLAAPLIPYLPKLVLGAGVIYLAFEMTVVRVSDQWFRMPGADRAVLLLVLASFLALGFLAGVAIGVVAGLALFAVSYGRIDLVRAAGNGTSFQSHVFRPPDQLRALAEHADAIEVVALQGYLFFGAAHNLQQRVKAQLGAGGRTTGRFLILDFARVDGADSSALFAFTRLFQEAEARGYAVLFAALPKRLSKALQVAGLAAAGQGRFPDLDHALEYAETAILGIDGAAAPQSGLDALEAASPTVDVRRQLLSYCARVTWQPGEWVVHQDDPSDAMFFVESGRLTVWRQLADGGRIRLGTIVPGTVIGEIGFYRHATRTASIVADQESSAFRITRQALRRMQEEQPWLSSMFHRFMASLAADRLADNLRRLDTGA